MSKEPLFAAMFDCSRNAVLNLVTAKAMAATIKSFGYNAMLLYTEDTYEIEGEPYFGYLRGRYSKEELRELDAYCDSIGIELIPCIQTLAHLNQIFHWSTYEDIHDSKDILLPKEERTYELIEKMFQTCHECFKTKRIHIGMDEADVGRGKYLDKHGYEKRKSIIADHLRRVLEIAKKYGFEPMMWSDMFYGSYFMSAPSKEERENIPEGVTMVYWDYYAPDKKHYVERIRNQTQDKNPVYFAGGIWSWMGFGPCNKYSLVRMSSSLKACREEGIKDVIMTMWKDNGGECSFFSLLPSLFAARRLYEGETSLPKIKKEFEALTKERWSDFMLLDSLNAFNLPQKKEITNVAKWATYEDPLFHSAYGHVDLSKEEEWKKISKKLKNAAKRSPNYAYVFEEGSALAAFLYYKYGLAKKIYNLYQSKDKDGLRELLPSFKKMQKALRAFYEKFRCLWNKENKSSGFEIQDARLGGLMLRLEDTERTLKEYIDGKIERIEELEDPFPLDALCANPSDPKAEFYENNYALWMSVNAY